MLKQPSFSPLTRGELELMQILWRLGPVTILEAQKGFERPIEYPTVQTRLNRLVEKGFAQKSVVRPAKYSAAIEKSEASAGHLNILLDRVAGGSVVPLISQLLEEHMLSDNELAALKKIIRKKEQNHADRSS